MNRPNIWRTLIAACALILAAHAVEESYATGLLGAAIWGYTL